MSNSGNCCGGAPEAVMCHGSISQIKFIDRIRSDRQLKIVSLLDGISAI